MRAFLGKLLSALEIDQRGSRIGKRADRIIERRSPYRLDPDCPARSQPPQRIVEAGGGGNQLGGGCGFEVRPAKARSALERAVRSEEHTSELQSLMRISYAVF